ncbi:hypothetical protein H9P43_002065 [Blastocladiella emersonii ATCC 22665]|nr:hypothetical protein H9P43_002065 [Blastocladiella emersonii ATCC 22665]
MTAPIAAADPLFLLGGHTADSPAATPLRDGDYLAALEAALAVPSIASALTLDTADFDATLTAIDSSVAASPALAEHLAASALLVYIQHNFTGPLADDAASRIPAALQPGTTPASLSADGEAVYHKSAFAGLLALALAVSAGYEANPRLAWWHARAQRVRQALLDNPAESVRTAALLALTAAEAGFAGFGEEDDESVRDLRAAWHVERALVWQAYGDDREAQAELERAVAKSGFAFEVSGLLGRRTKFQERSLTQLVVLAQSRDAAAAAPNDAAAQSGVSDVALNDDTLLDKPSLEGDTTRATQNLRVVDQCTLLGFLQHIKATNPADEITAEQMKPFVLRLLENPNNWTVHTVALLNRCRLEKAKSRTVERAVIQLQTLVDQIAKPHRDLDDEPASARLAWFFAVNCPSRWALEAELADALMSLGVVKSALEIYERLELWEKAVLCHMITERPDAAEKLLVRLLEAEPKAPKYLCLLGDVRGDISLYYDAWEASGNRFARAMRSLGHHYYKAGEYAKSVECYMNGLRINPLFQDAWFVCGCAALQTENWDAAVTAFSRCTGMDYENAEAWNNLATVYIKQARKPEAFTALQQGLKAKYDSWKMWTNLLYLAVDLGRLDDAMNAMTRVVEIRSASSGNGDAEAARLVRAGAVDTEILAMLVRAIMQLHAENPVPLRVERLAALVDLCTKAPLVGGEVWRIAAQFHTARGHPRAAIDAHVRAFRTVARDSYVDEHELANAVEALGDLFDAYQNLGDRTDPESGEPACADWAYQIKLAVRGVLGRARDFDGTAPHDKLGEMLEEIKELSR